ncbi:universal stress protein [Leifsonia aquatica]|uniref:universal stress protein n=1 Tax=Leifsonia aquatica TaxID=144185 RepID=UPI0028A69F54|nr:universal stress protein [Leifsonia aquatica]
MTTTIAVGVDGRPEHRAARDWAITRATRDGSRLELVYVIQRGWGDVLDEPDDALALAARRLVEADAAAADHVEGVSTTVRYGHVGTELVAAARDADLLVVGAHPATDRSQFTGSLAVRVSAGAAGPVAVVPHGWAGRDGGVTVGVDGGLPSELAVAFAADEAAALDAPLVVVCAGFTANPLLAGLVPEIGLGDRRERIVQKAAERARERHPSLDVRTRVIEAAPSRGLVEAAAGSALLVVGTHNRHAGGRFLLGSVSHDVLLNLRLPVVVAR